MTKAEIAWPDLLEVYLNSVWEDGENARIDVANRSILDTLHLVENSEKAAEAADITPLVETGQIRLSRSIPARVGYPKYNLGLLVETWDMLLAAPERRVVEPTAFFIKADRSHSSLLPASEPLNKYRAALNLVATLGRAALFTDIQHAKLVYFGSARIEVPICYDSNDFRLINPEQVEDLAATIEGNLHREQRLSILAEAITSLVAGQPESRRFTYLIQNVDELKKRVDEGYKLFASSFSYSKIRGEVEKSQTDYVNRIHNTFTDIQGQLLGLPVSAIIVATQLQATSVCGPKAIANMAILGGACLFATLLIASCVNQWLTLNTIKQEINDQYTKLNTDFSEIRDMFTGAFKTIERRICWHRAVLIAISLVALAGAWFTWRGFNIVNELNAWGCLIENGATNSSLSPE